MPQRRSQEWYAGPDPRNNYLHRAWMRRGVRDHAFDGRPQIAIANTASDLTPCNAHFDEVATSVKQGVYEAGGIPLNLPVMSPGETQMRPTAMLTSRCSRPACPCRADRQVPPGWPSTNQHPRSWKPSAPQSRI
jgi:dihydroxyacid dehydratase/phosphogluconate dehydratase